MHNSTISMARHPLARVATCKDRLNIHPSTIYKVTDAGAEHDGKDEISLDKNSADGYERWNRKSQHYRS